MGRIFKGYDPTLKRVVALKFLRLDSPAMVQRFVLEAQHQGSLDHPNICRVYEVGDWQGQPYIAMQFIQGDMLDVAAESLSLRDKVEVMETVAEAIHAAHRQGLIHRDIKPANIMVRRADDRKPKPYILDFGLARSVVASGLTIQGMVLGTAHYMAPEQTQGDQNAVGRPADVYGLGATLYRILCGQPPFASAEGLDAIRATRDEEVEPLGRLAPNLPADLQTIVMKCLEKDPKRRYPTARDLAEDLRRVLDDEPIRARTPTLAYRLEKWRRKHRALVALGAASLAMLLALGSWGVTNRLNASAQARWAQRFGQTAERLQAQLRYTHLLPIHDITAERQAIVAALAAMDQEIRKAGRLAAGPGHYAQGAICMALEDTDRAKPLLEQAWREGFRTPEVSYAYGRVLGQEYRLELAKAQAIEDGELRGARIQVLHKQFRDPAIRHLRAGAPVDPSGYPEALMAFYDGRLDEALLKARQVFQARPWFYEAKRLEGIILLDQARALQDPPRVLAALPQAAGVFLASQLVAPSDATLYLGEGQVWLEAIEQDFASGAADSQALKAFQTAAARAASVEPQAAAPLALLAEAGAIWARQRTGMNPDAIPRLETAYQIAEKAIALEPMDREAHLARGLVAYQQGRYLVAMTKNSRPKLEQAISDFNWLLAKDPGDTRASDLAASAYVCLISNDTYLGLPPFVDFEAMLKLSLESLHRNPNLGAIHRNLGYLWGERAEYERRTGLDPTPSTTQSAQQFQEALRISPSDFRDHYGLGNARLIQAEYELAMGQDPGPMAAMATQAYQRSLTIRPTVVDIYSVLAETQMVQAQAALEWNGDPAPALRCAEQWLAKGQKISPKDLEILLRQGQLLLLQARAAFAQKQDPQVHLSGAEATLRKILAHTSSWGKVFTCLGECQLLRAQFMKTPWTTEIARGEDYLARALAINPRDAEAHLMSGLLELTKAGHTGKAAEAAQAEASLGRALELNRNLERTIALGRAKKADA